MIPIYDCVSEIKYIPLKNGNVEIRGFISKGEKYTFNEECSRGDIIYYFGDAVAEMMMCGEYDFLENGICVLRFKSEACYDIELDECDGGGCAVCDGGVSAGDGTAIGGFDYDGNYGRMGNPVPVGGPDRWDTFLKYPTNKRKRKYGKTVRKK